MQRRLSTYPSGQHPSRWSSRLDSVYAVYAEMYPEMDQHEADMPSASVGFASREDERGTTISGLSTYTPQPPPSTVSKNRKSGPSATPWDERGATGLYGGGGRGADNRETGWTRGFAFSPPPPVTGCEEDLRFEEDSACGTSTPLASPAILDNATEDGRTLSTNSSAGKLSPTTSHSASMLRRAREEAQLNAPTDPEDTQSPPAPARPVHTVDIAQIKRQQAAATMPTPSEPMLFSKSLGKSKPKLPRAPTLRWRSRAKQGPSISNPILPPGFVESLGMQTFELHPGATPPPPQVATRSDRSTEAERTPTLAATPRAASPSPRTPPTARNFASNPKLTPVGFDNAHQEDPSSFYGTGFSGKPDLESNESSRGHRTGMPLWAESSMSFDAPASSSSWEYSHGRTDSSESSDSGFRDPWNSSTSAQPHHVEAESPAFGKHHQQLTGSFAMPTQPSLMQRFREDSVASAYSDHAPSPSTPATATFRRDPPLDLSRRGETTYSVASLSPSMAAPDDVIAWRFPQANAPQAQPLSNGFRNPFSSS